MNQPQEKKHFRYTIDSFADIKVIRFKIPDWECLSLKQKSLLYYLSEASKCGRDIFFEQKFKYNLQLRKILERIEAHYIGDREDSEYSQFLIYLKRFWFSNGIHHHYASDKFLPEFSKEYWYTLLQNTDIKDLLAPKQTWKDFYKASLAILFDPHHFEKGVNFDIEKGLIEASSCNYYQNISTKEAEDYYAKKYDPNNTEPLSYGLNSKLIKEQGQIKEEFYKLDGLYGPAIEKIIFFLEKAIAFSENPKQAAHLTKLIEFYKTGDLKIWDEYCILWTEDHHSFVDYTNGFIESYGDPLGRKASWESMANFKNIQGTLRTEIISKNAQWFEDHSPIDPRFKKEKVKGISAKVIHAVQLGGDCYPCPPIGINLPNADWIRKEHGSKSVSIENISGAYAAAALEGNSSLEEFAYDQEELDLDKKYGEMASNLHTDLHECLGHGSGKLLEGVNPDALKNYGAVLEEARADLFALYYIMDPKLIELELIPSLDLAKSEYNSMIRNGLMCQLVRIELGKNIEEAHMRDRALIARWAFEMAQPEKAIEKINKDGKTYFKIHDYTKLRSIFGEQLKEIQRIKSEGDFEKAKELVEKYGIQIDFSFHKQIRERYGKLNIKPYTGFVNPELIPIFAGENIIDIKVEYVDNFSKQMKNYSHRYAFLPITAYIS